MTVLALPVLLYRHFGTPLVEIDGSNYCQGSIGVHFYLCHLCLFHTCQEDPSPSIFGNPPVWLPPSHSSHPSQVCRKEQTDPPPPSLSWDAAHASTASCLVSCTKCRRWRTRDCPHTLNATNPKGAKVTAMARAPALLTNYPCFVLEQCAGRESVNFDKQSKVRE